jgi:hypothetical protein
MRRRVLAGAALAAVFALGTTTGSAGDDRALQRIGEDQVPLLMGSWALVGTWSVQVVLVNCQTGEEIPGVTFPALNTFLLGGSMLSDPAANPALTRTGHGVWAQADRRRYTNTVVLFRFNPDGSYAGTQTVRRHITVSRDAQEFTARDAITTATPGGTVVDTRCGLGRGQRLQL